MGAARAKGRRRYGDAGPQTRATPNLKLVKPAEDAAVEQRLTRLLVERCIKLRERRGEQFRFPLNKEQPHRVLDELDLMLERGEIDRKLFEAGKRYGDSYRMANYVGVYRCGLNLSSRSGKLAQHDIAAHRVKDYSYLQRVRRGAFGECPRELVGCATTSAGTNGALTGDRKNGGLGSKQWSSR
jgi:hypothetical protein